MATERELNHALYVVQSYVSKVGLYRISKLETAEFDKAVELLEREAPELGIKKWLGGEYDEEWEEDEVMKNPEFDAAVETIKDYMDAPKGDMPDKFEKAVRVIEREVKKVRENQRGEKYKDGEEWIYCSGGACDCHLLCCTVEIMLCRDCEKSDECFAHMGRERHEKMLSCLSERLEKS